MLDKSNNSYFTHKARTKNNEYVAKITSITAHLETGKDIFLDMACQSLFVWIQTTMCQGRRCGAVVSAVGLKHGFRVRIPAAAKGLQQAFNLNLLGLFGFRTENVLQQYRKNMKDYFYKKVTDFGGKLWL